MQLKKVLLSSFFFVAVSARAAEFPDAKALAGESAKLAPVDIAVDLSKLPAHETAALAKMVEAATWMDTLFLRQVWAGNETLLLKLVADTSPLGKERLKAFLQNKGPWLRLSAHASFIPGVGHKPAQGNFYPAEATQAEVDAWIKKLPAAQQADAKGFFTTLRRAPDGSWRTVPYSVEYQGELQHVAALLKEAAALTTQPTLKTFLEKRAQAFLTNNYYDSDVAWMKLESSIEPTVGPYEVYEDEWFNAKAAFEAFITLRDDAETAKLSKFSAELQDIENHLPIDPKWRNPKLGALAPIRVVNSIFSSGDANRGVQTAAYNLPNDEKIGQEMGTKRTMLRNIQEAKFQRVLVPISKKALSKKDQTRIAFDAFFTHILMHELMHGLGPSQVLVNGKSYTVREMLQETYSTLEEAKADISGLFALQYLIDKGVVEKSMEETLYPTFLASSFRSIRFGLNEAHGRGLAIQMNYLQDAGAYQVAQDGTFFVDVPKMKEAVKALTAELMTIQALGDKARAQALIQKLAVIRPSVKKVLATLDGIPVDIAPKYVTAMKLLEGSKSVKTAQK